jgi:hypothetical protein
MRNLAFACLFLAACHNNDTVGSADGGSSCGTAGQACMNGAGCCSGACDTVAGVCAVTGGACKVANDPCTLGTECCSNVCAGGKCGSTACKVLDDSCSAGSDCCTTICTNGKCAPIPTTTGAPPACQTLGNKCAANADCCSGNCQGGTCAASGATCASQGDICFKPADCCTTVCGIAAGQTVGTCGLVTTTGAGNCKVDGQACTTPDSCCSKQCVSTNTGGHVCQTAIGCRVVGDICTKDADCCGSASGGQCGAITCILDMTQHPPVGRCRNPMGENPEGAVCGGMNNPGGPARQDCCDCQPPKFDCCKADANGVFRCYGGSTSDCPSGYTGVAGCCIAAGEKCQFSSECCGGAPCVPDSSGQLRCGAANPDGGVTCQPKGSVCTSNGDCCAGLVCNLPAGATSGTCGTPTTPTGTDGGAPVCAANGQGCTMQSDCCSGLTCYQPGGTGLPCSGRSGCTCYTIIM